MAILCTGDCPSLPICFEIVQLGFLRTTWGNKKQEWETGWEWEMGNGNRKW